MCASYQKWEEPRVKLRYNFSNISIIPVQIIFYKYIIKKWYILEIEFQLFFPTYSNIHLTLPNFVKLSNSIVLLLWFCNLSSFSLTNDTNTSDLVVSQKVDRNKGSEPSDLSWNAHKSFAGKGEVLSLSRFRARSSAHTAREKFYIRAWVHATRVAASPTGATVR